jgi:putative hemolysin
MKKITLIIMALVAMLAVSACGEVKQDQTKKPTASKPRDMVAEQKAYCKENGWIYEEPITAGGAGSCKSAPSEPADSAPTEDDTVPTEDTDQSKQTVHNTNEWGQDDGMRVKVLSMQKVDSIPAADEFSSSVSDKAGSSLIAVRMEVQNAGKKAIDPLCGGGSGFVLLDQNDRNFDPLDKLLDINDNVCGDGIQPGFKSTYVMAFRLPAGSHIGGLVVWNSDASDDYDGGKTELLFKA